LNVFFCIVFGGYCTTQSIGFGPNFSIELATTTSQFRTNPYHLFVGYLFVGYTLHRPLYIKVISQTKQGFGLHPMSGLNITHRFGQAHATPGNGHGHCYTFFGGYKVASKNLDMFTGFTPNSTGFMFLEEVFIRIWNDFLHN